jgi:adenosylmethionine-8-amino-7-oxononanoate aminotransferase
MAKPRYQDHIFYRGLMDRYVTIDRGEGVYLYDTDGQRYLDAAGQGAGGIVSVGYGRREVAEAMALQAEKISFLHSSYFRSQAFLDLADRIVGIAPEGLNRVWLVSSGSEAVESALKLARQYHLGRGNHSKYRFVARWLSFHGATTGALAVTGLSGVRRGYEPLLADFPHIAPCYCYRCPFGKAYPECALACADDLEKQILQAGPETIAAFIAEPITISAAVGQVPPPEYFPRIREICDQYDILFVADCVQTGFGRAGTDFAITQWGVVPDLIVFDKGITGGYFPLGGLIVSDQITTVLLESFQGRVHHGQSYTGNPLSAAVGLKVLEIIEREELTKRAKVQGEALMEKLGNLRDRHTSIGDIRGRGLLAGIEFVADRASKERLSQEMAFSRRLAAAARARGVLISGLSGNAAYGESDQVRLMPPLTISDEELETVVGVLDEALTEVERQVMG